MQDRIIESLAFRYGRILPNLIPSVMKLREKENLNIKERNSNEPLPHVKNAEVTCVPSENIGAQKMMQENMQMALDDMHQQLIDDVSRFIDNQVRDIDWLTAPVTLDYLASDIDDRKIFNATSRIMNFRTGQVLAADESAADALIKLLAFFAALGDNGEVSKPMADKAKRWFVEAQPLLTELRLIKGSGKIDPVRYPTTLTTKEQDSLFENLKAFRKDILAPARKKQLSQNVHENAKFGLLGNLLSFFNSGGTSENQFNLITNKIGILKDQDLNKLYIPSYEGNASADAKKLAAFVQKQGGVGHYLTPHEEKKLNETDPEKYKDYRYLATKVRNAIKTKLREHIRKTGQPLMPAVKVKALMEKEGLPTHFIPKGFETGHYDEDMGMYNPKGVKFRSTQNGGYLTFNPNFDINVDRNQYLAIGQGIGDIKAAHRYSEGQQKVRNDKVGEAVEHNIANLKEFRQKWREDHTSSIAKDRMHAFIVEAMYQMGQRIGNEKQGTVNRATGEKERTFGVTTLQAKHFKPRGVGYTVIFPAKSGMTQTMDLQPDDPVKKRLVAFIRKLLVGKKPDDYVWTNKDKKRIHESGVNKYLKENIGWKGGSHKIRHVKGTLEFRKQVAADPPPKTPNQKQMDEYIKDKLLKVGMVLGHKRTKTDPKTGEKTQEPTDATASSYVDPTELAKFYRDKKLRLPNRLAKKVTD